jgi:type II secretory pathway component GspD/PulD (secretin)
VNRASTLKELTYAAGIFLCLTASSLVIAQESQPTASEALEAAVQLYEEGDYVGAQHALAQISQEDLDQDERSLHSEYVQRAALAVSMQDKAEADHEAAALAVSDGRIEKAKRLLRSVLDNQYASDEVIEAAESELELLEERWPSTPDEESEEPATTEANQSQQPETEQQSKVGEAEQPAQTEEAQQPRETTVAELSPDTEESEPDISTEMRSLRAKVLTRDGVEAMQAGRLADAERLFHQALANVPGYPEAEAGLRQLQKFERVESGAESLLDRIEARNAIAWQRTVANYRMLEREVREHVLNNRFNAARQTLLLAKQVVEAGKAFAEPVAKYEALLHDVRALERYVEEEERIYNEREVARQREEARIENQERLRRVEANRDKRVNALMDEALELRKNRDFEGAINVLRQVMAIEPNNDGARWIKEGLEDHLAYVEQREMRDQFERGSQRVLMDVDRSKIPWWQDVTYPKNWLEIINRPTRLPPGSESTGIDPDLQSALDVPVEIDFPNTPFGDAVRMLADASGANISVAWKSLASASIKPETPVNLTLTNPVPLGTALREVLDNVNGSAMELGYLPADGVIKVASRDVLDRMVFDRVYPVQDLLMPIPDFTDAPRMDMPDAGLNALAAQRMVYYGGGQAVFPEEKEAIQEQQLEQEANELIALIRKTVDPESWRETGGDIGSLVELNGQLVITQTPSAHARIGGLLAKLREQRAIQIALEARFITVQSNYLEELGIDLDIVLNAGNAGFDLLAGPGGSVQVDPVLGSRLLLPRSFSRLGFTPSAPTGGTSTATTEPLAQPFNAPALVPAQGNSFVGSGNMTPIPIINNVLQFTDPATLSSDIPGSFAGNPTLQPALQVFGSFLDNIQVDFLIRATEADSRTSLLIAPKLVLWNGQRAWVAVVNQQSFVSSLEPIVDAEGQAPIVNTIETGAVLDAQATVTADRRYVTMTLRPSVGRLLGIQTFAFSTGPAGSGQFVQLPNITRQVVRTTVSVPDGGTLLIGGQKLAGEIEVEAGPPILSKIPFLKRFYKSRTLVKDEQILLILVKPQILIPAETEEEAFPTFTAG